MESPRAVSEDTQPKLHALLLKSDATAEADVLAELAVHPELAKERDDSNMLPLLMEAGAHEAGAQGKEQ